MNKKLTGEGRVGEGEEEGEEVWRERGRERRREGDGRKRSQRTHPLFVYKLVLTIFHFF